MFSNYIESNINNDNSNDIKVQQLIDILKVSSLSTTKDYDIEKVNDLITIILSVKHDSSKFVDMYTRVIFSINPYVYEDPNSCPYLVLLDYSQNSTSSSRLSDLLTRSSDLSKSVNMSMAIIVTSFLHTLDMSPCHTEYTRKKKRKARRIIDDDDDDDEGKVNVTGMLYNMKNLISSFKDVEFDFIYRTLHVAFTVSIVIGQQQHTNTNSIIITMECLRRALGSLVNNYHNIQINSYLKNFLLWLLSPNGPETAALKNIDISFDLFKVFLSPQREQMIIDTFKSYSLVVEDQLKRKGTSASECHALLTRSFSIIKAALPHKLAIKTLAMSSIFLFSRAAFRLQAIKELSDYILHENLDEETLRSGLVHMYDVVMLDGAESVRLKCLELHKTIINQTTIRKETYRVFLLKLRDKSAKVRLECFKLLKSISIGDICDVLSRIELITAARYLFKIQSMIPIDSNNAEDKAFLANLLKACLDTSTTDNKMDVIAQELQIVSIDNIPNNMCKNVIMSL